MTAAPDVEAPSAGDAAQQASKRRRKTLLLQLGPATVWLLVFFIVPVCLIFVYSFYKFEDGFMTQALTLENYVQIFEYPVYRDAFLKSLRYGLIVTVLSLIIAYPVAYFLARVVTKHKTLLFLLLIVPFWTSIVVRTYAWKLLLGTNGLVNYYLMQLGLAEFPVKFLFTERAVIIGLIHVFLPFMILPLYAVLDKMDPRLEEAAMDLGAGRIRTFLKVTLPLSLPGVSTGCLLVFILTIGSYLTPDLLGGPSEQMISNVIQSEYYVSFNWPFGSALAVAFLLIVLAMVLIYNRLYRLDNLTGQG
ncbi:MAG: ABC transporter permease [Pseudomonadota bacterium]